MTDTAFRPRSATELVDAGVRLYRTHLATFVTIALVFLMPFSIVGVIGGPILAPLMFIARALVTPLAVAIIVGIIDDVMHGRPADASRGLARLKGRAGTLILITLGQGILTMLGFVLLVVPGVIALVWTFAAPMTVVVEGIDGTAAAFSRARELARGQFGHVFGTLLLAWVGVILLVMAGGMAIAGIGSLLHLSGSLQQLLNAALATVLMPASAAISGLLYFDLRVRSDAYDVETMIASLPPNATGAPSSSALPSDPARRP